MCTRNYRRYFGFILAITILTAKSILAMYWEVAFVAIDDQGNPTSVSFAVYLFNESTRNYEYFDGGSTTGDFGPYTIGGIVRQINAAFDMGTDGTDLDYPTISKVPPRDRILIKIANTYYKLDLSGGAYGDICFFINDGYQSVVLNSSGYSISTFTWTNNTISLRNDFGDDRSTAAGKIYLNSEQFNTGYSYVNENRESTTFPHTIYGEDNQYINQYYRIWRKWDDNDPSINKTLSNPASGSYTATYARKMSVTYRNYYNSGDQGGTIYLDDNSQGSPAALTLYDDLQYKLEAQNTTRNSVNYTFNHWEYESSNIGSSNPLSAYEVPGHGTLQAIFDHKPVNSYRYMHFNDSEYGEPVRIMWSKHPLDTSFVTQYAIWRKVKHNGVVGTPVQIATVTANASSTYQYVDNSYLITQGYTDDLLYYDVRAYYNPNSSAEDYEPVYGEMNYKIQEVNNMQASLSREVPSDYNIENYPNPFNPTTKITYQLPEKSNVILKIYDALGKEVRTLVNSNKEAGYYSIDFDASDLPSGVYIYQIQAGKFNESKKMLLVK